MSPSGTCQPVAWGAHLTRTSAVQIEIERGICQIILNRPDKLNAINIDVKAGLEAAFDRVSREPEIRVVVLRGRGKAFCSGGDLGSIQKREGMGRPQDLEYSHAILKKILNLGQVVICAVQGFAVGAGCNLAMAADLVYAAEGAKFAQAFVKVGLVPDWGGMYLLPALAGVRKAKEWFFFGERFDAREAMSHGLVNQVFPPEELLDRVMERAAALAAGPQAAIRMTKRIVDQVRPMGLDAVMKAEVEAFKECMRSEDFAEGLAAFADKRPPKFK